MGAVLFLPGLSGVLSLASMPFPIEMLPEEGRDAILEIFSLEQLRWLMLVNPTIMLLVAVIIGTLLFKKTGLTVPTIENLIHKREWLPIFSEQVRYGAGGGVVAGVLIVLTSFSFENILAEEMAILENAVQPSVWARFLYGGITEEILMRFGCMTLFVYLASLVSKKLIPGIYWFAILAAAVLFALGHLPTVLGIIPEPSSALYAYIMLGNMAGGIVFGWVYWKKGLEAAFVAHAMAHVVMLLFA